MDTQDKYITRERVVYQILSESRRDGRISKYQLGCPCPSIVTKYVNDRGTCEISPQEEKIYYAIHDLT